MGETYRCQNNPQLFPEAIWLYSRAIALDPAYADPHRGLGTLHYQTRQTDQAAAAFARYLELAPGAPDRGHIHNLLQGLQGEVRP